MLPIIFYRYAAAECRRWVFLAILMGKIVMIPGIDATAKTLKVNGAIVDLMSGMPVATAEVLMEKKGQVWSATTDTDGKFHFELLDSGQVTLRVRRLGYAPRQHVFSVHADTTLTIALIPVPINFPQVTVSAGMPERHQEMATSGQPIFLFTQNEMAGLNATDAAGVLAFAPGVFIKDYGGMGGLKTMSLRGTASVQTPVFIDGVRYDNYQIGSTDLSTLAITAFPRIRVIRGGNAARYGANAVAGLIDLQIDTPEDAPQLSISETGGSYDYQAENIALNNERFGLRSRIVWSRQRAEGDHTYRTEAFGEQLIRRRRNADFDQRNALLSLAYPGEGKLSARLSLFYYRGRRGVPGPVLQGNADSSLARQNDADYLATLRWRWQPGPDMVINWWLKYRQSELRYRDPLLRIRPAGVDDSYRNRDALFAAEMRRLTAIGQMQIRGEAGLAHLDGNNLTEPRGASYALVPYVQRRFVNTLLAWDNQTRNPEHADFVSWQVALRYTRYSDVGQALSPSMGINWRPWVTALHLRMHASHNFRAPTFAEQYYLNYGNQRVRPERSISFDIGGNYHAHLLGRMMLDLSFFAIRTRDQIIAIPHSPVRWATQNLGRSESFGLEGVLEWHAWRDRLRLSTTYTRQEPTDRTSGSRTHGKLVIYVPQEIVTTVLATEWPITQNLTLRIGGSMRHVSHRFHLPENDLESLMPGYTVIDANIALHLSVWNLNGAFRLELENLTNTDYEVIRHYPVPLRLWRLGVKMGVK
jgi:outer membrane cobalamin receptor